MSAIRVETTEHCTLYLGDCLDVLPTLGKVDAVVTDPPYGIGFKYESHEDTPDGYGDWLWSILYTCEGKCTEGAPFFVFQAMKNIAMFSTWFPRKWRILAAAKNFVQMRPTAMQYAFDPVVVWWVAGKAWSAGTASRDWFVANTAPVIAKPSNIERGHPCPRPLDQMEHIVSQWVRPGDTAIDPFMGSGTTGVACVRTGRRFIGIEKEEKYFEIALRRIREAERMAKCDLFKEPKPVERRQLELV